MSQKSYLSGAGNERLAELDKIEFEARLLSVRETPLFGGRFKVRPTKLLLYITGLWVVPAIGSKKTMFDLLADYTPVDTDAYKGLQTLASGEELTGADVLTWLDKERASFAPAQVAAVEIARTRFINHQRS